jgi:hypothetical protein
MGLEKDYEKESTGLTNINQESTSKNENDASGFVDNSPEAIEARKLQEAADNSTDAIEARRMQEVADSSSESIEMFQDPLQDGGGWIIDNRELVGDGEIIEYESLEDVEDRLSVLRQMNIWEELRVNQRTEGNKTFFFVETRGQRTVQNFIDLVRKIEIAYPNWTTNDVLGALRGQMSSNNDNFRRIMGKDSLAEEIEIIESFLTREDLLSIQSMIAHNGDGEEQEETGVAVDALGNTLALGHVLTGVEAGVNRQASVYAAASGQFIQEPLDNLYATTISGDLGQSAALEDSVFSDGVMIGNGTEATDAELIGDIDGFNIGSEFEEDEDVPPLSELLMGYYNEVYLTENENRFERFIENSEVNEEVFENHVTDFAWNWKFKESYIYIDGLFTAIQEEATEAVVQFRDWLDIQLEVDANIDMRETITIKSETENVFVVSDPKLWINTGKNKEWNPANDYKSNKDIIKAELMTAPPINEIGTRAVVLDTGGSETFNQVVDEKYKWVKVCIIEGTSEGVIGWVSNLFISKETEDE